MRGRTPRAAGPGQTGEGRGALIAVALSALLHFGVLLLLPRVTSAPSPERRAPVEISLIAPAAAPPVPVRPRPGRAIRWPGSSRRWRGNAWTRRPAGRAPAPHPAPKAGVHGPPPRRFSIARSSPLPGAPHPLAAFTPPQSEELPPVPIPTVTRPIGVTPSPVRDSAPATRPGEGDTGTGVSGKAAAESGTGAAGGNGRGESSGEGSGGEGGQGGAGGKGTGEGEAIRPHRPPAEPPKAEPAPARPVLREPEPPKPAPPEASRPAPAPAPAAVEPPPLTQPRYRRNPPPAYPREARRNHQEGTVRLAISVNARGDVDQVEVIESSGTPALDAAAREAVLRWKFEPGRRGDTPIACRVTVPVHFRLD